MGAGVKITFTGSGGTITPGNTPFKDLVINAGAARTLSADLQAETLEVSGVLTIDAGITATVTKMPGNAGWVHILNGGEILGTAGSPPLTFNAKIVTDFIEETGPSPTGKLNGTIDIESMKGISLDGPNTASVSLKNTGSGHISYVNGGTSTIGLAENTAPNSTITITNASGAAALTIDDGASGAADAVKTPGLITINLPSGTLAIHDNIESTGGNIEINSDVAISVTGSPSVKAVNGAITIQPVSTGTDIHIQDDLANPAPGLRIPAALLANLSAAQVIIGKIDGEGAFYIGNESTGTITGNSYPLTLRGAPAVPSNTMLFRLAAPAHTMDWAGQNFTISIGGDITHGGSADADLTLSAGILSITAANTGAAAPGHPLPVSITNLGECTMNAAGSMYLKNRHNGLLRVMGAVTAGTILDIDAEGSIAQSNSTPPGFGSLHVPEAFITAVKGIALDYGSGSNRNEIERLHLLNHDSLVTSDTAAGEVAFKNNRGSGLTLEARNDAAAGNITITEAAGNMTVDSTAVTSRGGAITLNAAGDLSVNSTAGPAIQSGGGLITLNAAGTIIVDSGDAASPPMAVASTGGAVTLTAGPGEFITLIKGINSYDGSAAGGNILFNSPVVLQAPISVSTGTGAGNIAFEHELQSEAGSSYTLSLDTGGGDISLKGMAENGGVRTELIIGGADNAHNVLFNDTGTVPDYKVKAINITHTGVFTQNDGAVIDAPDGFIQHSPASSAPAVLSKIAANITTANAPITFNGPIELTAPADPALPATFKSNGGAISLAAVTDGATPGDYSLVLDADGVSPTLGRIVLNGNVRVKEFTLTAHGGAAPGTDDTLVEAGAGISPRGPMTVNGGLTNKGTIAAGGLMTVNGDVVNNGTITAGPLADESEAMVFNGNYTEASGTPAAGRSSLEGNGSTNPDIVFTGAAVVLNSAAQHGDRLVFSDPRNEFQTLSAAAELENILVNRPDVLGDPQTLRAISGITQAGGSTLEIAAGNLDLFDGANPTGWAIGAALPAGFQGFIGSNGRLVFGDDTDSQGKKTAELIVRGDVSLGETAGSTFTIDTSGLTFSQNWAPRPYELARFTILEPGTTLTIKNKALFTGPERLFFNFVSGGTQTLNAAPGHPLPGIALSDTAGRKLEPGTQDSGTLALAAENLILQGSVYIGKKKTFDPGTGASTTMVLGSGFSIEYTRKITVKGNWLNEKDRGGDPADDGKFEIRQSYVDFTGDEIFISGSTTWYIFECTKPGAYIYFSTYDHLEPIDINHSSINISTITNPDVHTVHALFKVDPKNDAAGSYINVTRGPRGHREPVEVSSSNNKDNDPTPPENFLSWEFPHNRGKFWDLNMVPGARLEINHINLYYCHSLRRIPIPHSEVTGINVNADPYYLDAGRNPIDPHYFNINWITLDQFYYSYTEDMDQNGRIDRIRLQSAFEIFFDDNEGGAGGFELEVEGYEIDKTKGEDGSGVEIVGTGIQNKYDSIYVYLKEKNYSDGDAILRWRIIKNTSLKERTSGATLIGKVDEIGVTIDTVPPRINYALALPGKNEIFLQFSEPVSAVAGTSLSFRYPSGDFPGTLPGYSMTVKKLNDREYLLSVTDSGAPRAFTIEELAGGLKHFVVTNAADLAERAYDVNHYYPDNPQYPVPAYPMDWRYDNYKIVRYDEHPPGALVPQNRLAGLDYTGSNYFELSSNPGVLTPKELPAPLPEVFHRVTDLLISVPPSSAAEENYFVWPVWAKDNDAAAPDSRGVDFPGHSFTDSGVIWDFTGKAAFLRHRDLTIQARRNPKLDALLGDPQLYYANVGDPYRADPRHGLEGLWLPSAGFDTRDFSNIVPKPLETSPALNPDTAGAAPPLFNFKIGKNLGGKLNFENKKDLEFFFRLKDSPTDPTYPGQSGPGPLYAGRLVFDRGAPPPADWYRRVNPFILEIHDITLQRSGVTILNNVINPGRGEKTYVDYILTKSGQVTVQVFTLDGTLIKVLRRQSLSAGEYREHWDGTNRGGRAVARGMYFIRVVGPDIDEIRKVMVVK
jgi:hypothetical protein